VKLKEIKRYLNENGIYPDVIYAHDSDILEIEINDGDWKHEHGRCRHLMTAVGYAQQEVITTEEDGSDCYSAIHRYVKF
jgi:hypothetical protein